MKMSYIAVVITILTFLISSGSALAARKSATVQGVLDVSPQGVGVLKSMIESKANYTFDTSSETGKKILSICQTGKICVVRGIISGNQILNAYYVNIGQ